MEYKVYCLTFPDGKKYVGMTKQDIRRRWRKGKGYEGQPVYDAIMACGWENIKHEILFTCETKEEAEAKEIELISTLNARKNGYNVEIGGDYSPLAEETKEKLRQGRKEYYKTHEHWHAGGHWSEEVKAKISKAHTGKKMSEEQRQKRIGMFAGKKNPMYGVKMTKEHKAKLQAACVKATSKPCKCVETGIIYDSAVDAQRKTGICAGTIRNVCKKHPKYKRAGGYHWEYV